MTRNRIAGVVTALALLTVPAAASAHGNSHHGRHHHKHHAKKAHSREVTGTATATVASFTNGELTIALPSGKTFSALVTDRTIIKCQTVAPQPTTAKTARHGNDDHGDDNAPPATAPAPANAQDDNNQGDDHNGRGDDNDQGDDNGNGRCGTEALVAGAKVSEAKLSLKGEDVTWKKVEILK
ncbi:MAG: hypothetical protein JWR63_3657 [Conexibacter sp.]|nr:hypothetical protein [Conexibacter sp.]